MGKDWKEIYKKYRGLWVALKSDEKTVVGSGKTAHEAWSKAQRKGYKSPIMARMPKRLVTYVGMGWPS